MGLLAGEQVGEGGWLASRERGTGHSMAVGGGEATWNTLVRPNGPGKNGHRPHKAGCRGVDSRLGKGP